MHFLIKNDKIGQKIAPFSLTLAKPSIFYLYKGQ